MIKNVSQRISLFTDSPVDLGSHETTKCVDGIIKGALEWNRKVKSSDVFLDWAPFVIPPATPFQLPSMEPDESTSIPSGASAYPVWGLSMGIKTSQVQDDGKVEMHVQLKGRVVTAGFVLATAN